MRGGRVEARARWNTRQRGLPISDPSVDGSNSCLVVSPLAKGMLPCFAVLTAMRHWDGGVSLPSFRRFTHQTHFLSCFFFFLTPSYDGLD
jgi:hypothetical protein